MHITGKVLFQRHQSLGTRYATHKKERITRTAVIKRKPLEYMAQQGLLPRCLLQQIQALE